MQDIVSVAVYLAKYTMWKQLIIFLVVCHKVVEIYRYFTTNLTDRVPTVYIIYRPLIIG